MKTTNVFSGNQFAAEQKAKECSPQLCKHYPDGYVLTLWMKEQRKIRCGVKRQDIIMSCEELIKLQKNIADILNEKQP